MKLTMILVVMAFGFFGCGQEAPRSAEDPASALPPVPSNDLLSIQVSPGVLPLALQESRMLSAGGIYRLGTGPVTVTWVSSNAQVATVDANGLVVARGLGSATITARAVVDSRIQGFSQITVEAIPLHGVDDFLGIVAYSSGAASPLPVLFQDPWPSDSACTGFVATSSVFYLAFGDGEIFSASAGRFVRICSVPGGGCTGLALDNGRLYTVGNSFTTSGGVYEISTATGTVSSVTTLPELIEGAPAQILVLNGRVLVLRMGYPGEALLMSLGSDGTIEKVADVTDRSEFLPAGIAVDPDGAIWCLNGRAGGGLYRLFDANGDGNYLDAGETSYLNQNFRAANGIVATDGDLLVSDPVSPSGIYRVDRSTGAASVWNSVAVTGAFGGRLAASGRVTLPPGAPVPPPAPNPNPNPNPNGPVIPGFPPPAPIPAP